MGDMVRGFGNIDVVAVLHVTRCHAIWLFRRIQWQKVFTGHVVLCLQLHCFMS